MGKIYWQYTTHLFSFLKLFKNSFTPWVLVSKALACMSNVLTPDGRTSLMNLIMFLLYCDTLKHCHCKGGSLSSRKKCIIYMILQWFSFYEISRYLKLVYKVAVNIAKDRRSPNIYTHSDYQLAHEDQFSFTG